MTGMDSPRSDTPSGNAPADAPAPGFFASRWNGAVPVDRLFWVDTVLVGTLLNVVAAFAGVLALGFKAPEWLSLALYLSPMPYNLFLVLAIWRSTDRPGTTARAAYRIGALIWFAAGVLI